jgi:transketolase
VVRDVDGHDAGAVDVAIREARTETDRPTLIQCKTIIGWGAPNKQGTESVHGAALGEDEVALARETIGWPHPPFEIPDEIYAAWDGRKNGKASESDWGKRFEAYRKAHPHLAAELERCMNGEFPKDWNQYCDKLIRDTDDKAENIASRKASQNALEGFGPKLPELIGGSADLTGSNLTRWSGSRALSAEVDDGNYIYFGVREFAMAAICNGIALHGGLIPYCATFLIFSEYARNALRMAALMKIRSIFVFTHDSIGLGEDGPTHQAVEQTATMRLMPNMSVWRPCDAVESAVAWERALQRTAGPTSLLFSRQGLPHQKRTREQIAAIRRGGYVLRDCDAKGVKARVVSIPSTDTFDAQPESYRESVLPSSVRSRVSVEAGVTGYWYKYLGFEGKAVGIDTFGESAPCEEVFAHFGFTVENVVKTVEAVLAADASTRIGAAAES